MFADTPLFFESRLRCDMNSCSVAPISPCEPILHFNNSVLITVLLLHCCYAAFRLHIITAQLQRNNNDIRLQKKPTENAMNCVISARQPFQRNTLSANGTDIRRDERARTIWTIERRGVAV